MLCFWFAFSALAVLLLIVGNFLLMAGGNPFHLVFWVLLFLGIWYGIEAVRSRGVKGWAWRMLISSLITWVFIFLVVAVGFWLAAWVRVPERDAALVLGIWLLCAVMAGILLFLATSRLALRKTKAGTAVGAGDEEKDKATRSRLRWIANAFSASVVTNVLFLAALFVVVTNYPKDPPHQTAFPIEPGDELQQQAYRELLRWARREPSVEEEKYLGRAPDWYPDLTEPSQNVAHPAPANQALAQAFDPENPDSQHFETLVQGYIHFWDEPEKPIEITPEIRAAIEKSSGLLREYYRFLAAHDPVPPHIGFGVPVHDFLTVRKTNQAMAFLVLAQIAEGEPEQAVADYLLWGRGAHQRLVHSYTLVELMINVAVVNSWMNRFPDILPHTTENDRELLRDLVQSLRQDFPAAQRGAWTGEIAGAREAYQVVFQTGNVTKVLQLHEVLLSDSSEPFRPETLAQALGLQPLLNRLQLTLYDPHATARESEELLTPLIAISDPPFHEAEAELEKFEQRVESMMQNNFYIRPRNPVGGVLMTIALPSFRRAQLRCAANRAKLAMLQWALDATDNPADLPPAPYNEISDAPFFLTLDEDNRQATLRFPEDSPIKDVVEEEFLSLTIPLPGQNDQ